MNAATGAESPLFDALRAEASLAAIPGVSVSEAANAVRSRRVVFNQRSTAALLTIQNELYVLTFGDARVRKITSSGGGKEEATLSPDGSAAAFVRDNNLFLVDVAAGRETAVTHDGSPKILNGRMDWVYQEEIYGRGTTRVYWWSPDSSRVAFLRIDDTPVSTYITLDDISYEPKVETWSYPRAGDANPNATLGVARITGGTVEWVDLSRYSAEDMLIVRVGWTPAGQLLYEIENRTQSWLDLNVGGRTLFRETSRSWINSEDQTTPTWLRDGSFVWLSAQSGFAHAYHYRADGSLIRPLTSGRWEVRDVHGVDERNGWLYFSGTERSSIGEDIYRVKLDGGGPQRLSRTSGTHDAQFSQDFSYFFDRWSAVMTPTQVWLHRATATTCVSFTRMWSARLRSTSFSNPEFMQVKTRDGFIDGSDDDQAARFRSVEEVSGLSSSPTPARTRSRSATRGAARSIMCHQFLAQHGIIVWICDNRSASGKGRGVGVDVVQAALGEGELRDIEDGLKLAEAAAVCRRSRVGIQRLELRRIHDVVRADAQHELWSAGISGGTVSDWRDYDSIYTERVMLMPQNNPEGYRNTLAALGREEPARQAPADARHDRRQRAHAEHDSVHLRAGEGEQAVSADALSEVTPRRDGSVARASPARADARLHAGTPQTLIRRGLL